MTAYFSSALLSAPPAMGTKVHLRAGLYELRVIALGYSASYVRMALTRRSGATFSGGTTVPVTPFREGAPPASATVRTNATISGGTSVTVTDFPTGTSSPGVDLTVAPGSAVIFTVDQTSEFQETDVPVYFRFEELLLSWHF